MKTLLSRLIPFGALLLALALPARAQESKRGIYEGNLTTGGRIVFFVQGNNAPSVYVFDTAVRQADFGGGAIAANGTFALTTQGNRIITGTVSKPMVTAKVNALNVSAIELGSSAAAMISAVASPRPRTAPVG